MPSAQLTSFLATIFNRVRRSDGTGAAIAAESPVVFENCKDIEAGVSLDNEKPVICLKHTRKTSLRKSKLNVE